jgi:ubiquinone/menaquinone biosynthesis C-methylase UbiE
MADFLSVSEVLSNLDLKKSNSVAEFGCGSADFAIAIAKKVSKGKVYALDVQQEKLEILKNKMALQKIKNIVLVRCDLEAPKGSGLRNNFLDMVIIPNLLFQVENRSAIMEEVARVVKTGGHILIIDWIKSVAFGPKENIMDPDEAKAMAVKMGLRLEKEFACGDYHYALLFIK